MLTLLFTMIKTWVFMFEYHLSLLCKVESLLTINCTRKFSCANPIAMHGRYTGKTYHWVVVMEDKFYAHLQK